MKRNKYEIREICGDWALDIRRGADTITLFFNSRNNAELVKTIFEWEDAHPNEAAPYTFPSPNDWISVKDRLPKLQDNDYCWVMVLACKKNEQRIYAYVL